MTASIKIQSAYYGSSKIAAVPVTDKITAITEAAINARPQKDQATVAVNQATLGVANPHPDTLMSLSINYVYGSKPDAQVVTVSAMENKTISLQVFTENYVIDKAIYSGGGAFLDITEKFNDAILVSNDHLSCTVGSADFLSRYCYGHDIAQGVHKVLQVSYIAPDLQTHYACATDSQTLDLTAL